MARILVEGDWYEEIAPTSLYESEFERMILERVSLIYPEFNAVPFKTTVYDDEGAAKPDFTLIERDYREWWVVEVEMSNHSLDSHILPQVKILSNAAYGEPEAEFLCKKDPELDLHRLLDMMKGRQPRVIVIVNEQQPDWIQPLKRFDAILTICEIFRSEKNKHILRLNGEHPELQESIISKCQSDPLLPRLLVIESPGGLGIPPGKKVKIHYKDGITEWERIDVENKVWLSPVGPNPLQTKKQYELFRSSDGSLTFQESD